MTDILGPVMPFLKLAGQLAAVFYVVFHLSLVFWVVRDAQRRGAMAWFWGVATLLFGVLSWAVYLVVRPPETLDDAHERELEIAAREAELQRAGSTCPHCFKPIESDYLICPTCLKQLKKPCSSCGRPVKSSWTVCPYCKTRQAVGERVPDAPEGPAAEDHAQTHVASNTPKKKKAAPAQNEA